MVKCIGVAVPTAAALVLFLALVASPALAKRKSKDFKFSEFMEGVWDVHEVGMQCLGVEARNQHLDQDDCEPTKRKLLYNITRPVPDGDNLAGVISAFDAAQNVAVPELDARIIMSGNLTGTFETASAEDLEADVEFEFNFQKLSPRHYVSSGKYGPKHTYTFTLVNPNDFFLTIHDGESGLALTAYSGARLIQKPPPTFLKQWGPTGLIAVLFIGQVVLKSYFRGRTGVPPSVRAAQTASRQEASPAAGKSARSSSGGAAGSSESKKSK